MLLIAACKGGDSGLTTPSISVEAHSANYFPIAEGPHAVECNTCHTPTATFEQFDCLGCHGHEQPPTDLLHTSLPADQAPQYAYDSKACYSCHRTGAKQPYDHLNITSGCATCHDVDTLWAALPRKDGQPHGPTNGADCSGCHFSTTDWKTSGAPSAPATDPAHDITVDALIPTYSGPYIADLAPLAQTLKMWMNHGSTQIDATALADCSNCHNDAATDPNAPVYFPGTLHSALANLKLAQPTQCSDCHTSGSFPIGFVGPTATNPARTPASGEMKHDAVAWAGGVPTTTPLVPGECGNCHLPPSQSGVADWSTDRNGASPTRFHANLKPAAQPRSCIDCHANTRPKTVLAPPTTPLPAGVRFDHDSPEALADCVGCHVTASGVHPADWTGGTFHHVGDVTPTTCSPCHDGERPTSTAGWKSTTYTNAPFDYVTNALGISHGDGQDCAVCHKGPGTGAWGAGQNWQGGAFPHGAATVAKATCIACHSTQRPDLLLGAGPANTLLGFDHASNGTGDCFGCHQATVAAGTYATYYNATTKALPNGDWKGGLTYPGSVLAGGADQFISVTELTLHRSGASNLVTSITSATTAIYNQMLHTSTALPTELNAGPSTAPDNAKCWHCHTHTAGTTTVTSLANGKYHASLTGYQATPSGAVMAFPQPTTLCSDCHVNGAPTGIVEKGASDLQPMDHAAKFTAAVTIGGKSVTGVADMECATCHHMPNVSWGDGTFHASIGAAQPADCVGCHYPLMADGPKANLTNGTLYTMAHASLQLTSQACQSCHTGALAKATGTPASTLWSGATYHGGITAQPKLCNDCHTVSEPKANAATQSSVSYAMPKGGTASNGAQWMNHGAADVAGKDCASCHLADAKASGSAWSKSDSFHATVTRPQGCQACHGVGNGGGTVVGTNNNLPMGLTDSTMVSTAAKDATTGVPAGTLDQITHADASVSGHDCNFCHTQAGASTVAGTMGKEWAKATFHVNFNAGAPLTINGTTGRCSNCHMNIVPKSTFPGFDHTGLSNTPGTDDCSKCHSWPGTGTSSTPNWLGAAGGAPPNITVGGFTVPKPPAAAPVTQGGINALPHPNTATAACTSCHSTAGGGKKAIGYDHASTLINSNCNSCHEAGSDLVGTPWNGATTQAAGAGDTRPFTTTVKACQGCGSGNTLENYPNHFYPVDCTQCHNAPAGVIATATSGTAYIGTKTSAWWFKHRESAMTNPSTCVMCHKNGIPN